MKKKLWIGAIYVAAFAVLLGLLIWYGMSVVSVLHVDLTGGTQIDTSNKTEFEKLPFETAEPTEPEESADVTKPEKPVEPPVVLPPDLITESVYQYETFCAVFDAKGNMRIYVIGENISLDCILLTSLDAVLYMQYGEEVIEVVVGFGDITIHARKLLDDLDYFNLMFPGILKLSLYQSTPFCELKSE